MNRTEVAALLAYAVGLDPRSAPAEQSAANDTLNQWEEVLRDVPPTAPHPSGRHWNAAEAVRHHIATSPYPIKPSDVSRPWYVFRADVIGRHHDPVPAADPDDPESWRAELLGTRHAVATGAAAPAPLRELLGGTRDERDAEAAAVLARLGTYVPRQVRDAIAPRTTTVHHGQRVAGPERLPRMAALAVPCPHTGCLARANRPCKTAGGRERRQSVHDQRQDAYAAAIAAQEATA